MNINVLFFILLTFFLSSTLFIAYIHHQYTQSWTIRSPSSSSSLRIISEKLQQNLTSSGVVVEKQEEEEVEHEHGKIKTLFKNEILEAHLSCKAYGGPMDDDDEVAQQMVYWSDIPKDAQFQSPFKKSNTSQYLVFEPDGGGWNNARMAMETIVVFAHAMGRTLVMPPAQRIYLLGKAPLKQKIHFSFADFYPLDLINKEHIGLEIISMEEYLKREKGNFRDKETGKVSWPPGNRTNFDGDSESLKLWLRTVLYTPKWNSDATLFVFPDGKNSNITNIREVHNSLQHFQRDLKYMTPVNASLRERMAENLIERGLTIYDPRLQEERTLLFMCYHKERVRYLVHFYAFIFFENWKNQLWVNRFVRDHLRYIDELQCAAARIVDAVAKRALRRNSSSHGQFDSFHIRRGDFQYEDMVVNASILYESCMDIIPAGATVYVSTDEKDRSYFQPLADHYDLVYLDDFVSLVKDLNTNYYGMLDQLIASKGRYFFGTYYSTFTGFINRMRGYHVTKNKLEGYEDGAIQSYYFLPTDKKDVMRHYEAIKQLLFAREFPTAWRDIDRGIMEL